MFLKQMFWIVGLRCQSPGKSPFVWHIKASVNGKVNADACAATNLQKAKLTAVTAINACVNASAKGHAFASQDARSAGGVR